jgi:hypothetical protein
MFMHVHSSRASVFFQYMKVMEGFWYIKLPPPLPRPMGSTNTTFRIRLSDSIKDLALLTTFNSKFLLKG